MCDGPVAQWIEQLRPKEKVVRSTRTRVTKFELKAATNGIFSCSLIDKMHFARRKHRSGGFYSRISFILECEANDSSPAVGGERKSKTCFRFTEPTPGGKALRSKALLAPGSPKYLTLPEAFFSLESNLTVRLTPGSPNLS